MSPTKEITERIWFQFIECYENDKRSGDSRPPYIDTTNRDNFIGSLKEKIRREKDGYKLISQILISPKKIEREICIRRQILGI